METMYAIKTRRSVRKYKAEQITDVQLYTILAAGSAAAVGMAAYDRLHMAVVQNSELLMQVNDAIAGFMAKIMPNAGKGDFIKGAPTIVVISAKEPDSSPMKGMHYINAGCVAENMMLAAVDVGLSSYVIGSAGDGIGGDAQLQHALGIPEEFTPLFAIALGYDGEEKTVEKDMTLKIAVSRV